MKKKKAAAFLSCSQKPDWSIACSGRHFSIISRSLPLRHELFEKDAIILDQLASKSVQLLSKKSGKGLKFDFSDFENLVLWSTNNKGPFIALEPWTGISTSAEEGDFFEDKKGVIELAPQETRSHQYRITIL